MRPEKLTMCGFGPYAEKTVVPFSRLGDHGIYLITGDTGAGKTTVFDGIVFALYGEASGDARKADMMRSDFAAAGEKTYVELEFTCRGKRYQVVRNPEYLRPKTRGKGMTKEAADAALTYPDGRVTAGSRQATREVEEIIGLDRNQFVQIAMIAQGEFLKLLLAGTEERGRIFRRLFHTGQYLEFQKRLKKRMLEMKQTYEGLQRSVGQYTAEIRLPEAEDGQEQLWLEELRQWRDAGTVYGLSEGIRCLEHLLERERRKQQEKESLLADRDSRLMKLQERLGRLQMAERAREESLRKEELLKELALERGGLERGYEEALKGQPEAEEAAKQIIVQEEQMPEYDALELLLAGIGKLQQKEKELERSIPELEKKRKEAETQLSGDGVRIRELGAPEQELLRLETRAERCAAVKKELTELERLLNQQRSQRQRMERARQAFLQARDRNSSLGRRYTELEALFLNGQAGILAETLEEGCPCPVCGSTEHPFPAGRSACVPTEQELKTMGKQKEQAQAEAAEASERLAGARGRWEESQRAVAAWFERAQEEAEDLRGMGGEEYLLERQKSLSEEETMLHRLSRETELLVQEKKRLEARKPGLEHQLELLRRETEEKERERIRCHTELEGQRRQLERLRKGLRYETKQEAKQVLALLKQKKEQTEQTIRRAKERLDQCKNRIEAEQKAWNTLRQQAETGEPETMEALLKQKEALAAGKRELEQSQKQQHVLLQTNGRILERLKSSEKKLKETEEAYATLASLSDTANGELKGRQKLAFEQYIQIVFFNQTIREANRRFRSMTGGRYLLRRCEEADNLRSQTGLELDVFDYYTGKPRSVRSLSGGEAFKASLSLALGLADVVQQYAGGIQMDTVFIDEGFGSLDHESLNQAITILKELAGSRRLVGIISHVDELKERIPRKIIVKKGTAGSTLSLVKES